LMLFVPVRGLARLGTATIEPHQAVVVGAATQVVAFADKNFLPISIALDSRALAEVADDLKAAIDAPDEVRDVHCLRISASRLLGLDRLVQEILQAAAAPPEQLCAADSLTALEDELLNWCAALLQHSDARDHRLARVAARRRAALRAREFIDTHLDQRLSLSQVCRASYASARALTYGFREMFDLTPMTYVRFARMAHVRSELYFTPPHRYAVTALARKWGFWHLGQFSKEYCALFGELPSSTLGRGAASAAESTRYARRAAVCR
jgi:AraC family ethanolamine operon transcriptional activator